MQISRDELQQLFAEIFETDAQSFTFATVPGDIATWDSFNHLNMVMALEERYGVSFSTDEVASMSSVGATVALLQEHGVAVDWAA